MIATGTLLAPLDVGPIAHGGHCVARLDGLVVFVRHTAPGERVVARVTEVSRTFIRADAVEILDAHPGRVRPPCPVAGICGGCDFQHISPVTQRQLKADVVADQFRRLAGIEVEVTVEAVRPLVGWRTRMRYRVEDGVAGLRGYRSDDLVALPEGGCRIAAPGLEVPPTASDGDVIGVAAGSGVVWQGPDEASELVSERAGRRSYDVWSDGFWQVHPRAAAVLTEAVISGLRVRPGELALDLYCGVGLFAGALVDARCDVIAVEGNRHAVELARRNVPDAAFVASDVQAALTGSRRGRGRLPGLADVVVLDPPRSGAGAVVVEQVMIRRPRAVAYVACDPAALARDVGTFLAAGWTLESIRAFDLFPMTHHVECVAILRPARQDG